MADGSQEQHRLKRRAACDECRTKKLKCTGEQPSCSRCVRENITCVYSPQKQMGRPKKRQRSEDGSGNVHSNSSGSGSSMQQQVWHDASGGQGLDMEAFDTAFGSNLQPWLQSPVDWDFSLPDAGSIPALTPDSSTNSPPTLNLPPELQNTTNHHHHHHHQNHNHSTDLTSTQLLLDPSLTDPNAAPTNLGMPSSLLPTCACLSTLYLTLSNLQNMSPTFDFPFALHRLREAMSTASDVLRCEQCPTRLISAMQNTQLVGTLLVSIAERFSKILDSITTEAERAEQADESKKFRLADLNTSTLHLHTGGLGCAAAFSVNLSPREWRDMTKKVIRAEVYGPNDGNHCCPFFWGLAQQMQERQEFYHTRPLPEDFPKNPETGVPMGGRFVPREEHLCLKLVGYARKLVDGFDWS